MSNFCSFQSSQFFLPHDQHLLSLLVDNLSFYFTNEMEATWQKFLSSSPPMYKHNYRYLDHSLFLLSYYNRRGIWYLKLLTHLYFGSHILFFLKDLILLLSLLYLQSLLSTESFPLAFTHQVFLISLTPSLKPFLFSLLPTQELPLFSVSISPCNHFLTW